MKQNLRYANYRSIYNALNQNKITEKNIQKLFLKKGILCSKSTKRDVLSAYYSRLTHDFFDHKLIADSLGIIPRREKITSTEIISKDKSNISYDDIKEKFKDLETDLNSTGCIAKYKSTGNEQEIDITYTEIDYSKSDFQQMTTRTGNISAIIDNNIIHIRSTQTKFINQVKDSFVKNIITLNEDNLIKNNICLNELNDHELRTKFFLDTVRTIDDYQLEEIPQIGLFKNIKLVFDETEFDTNNEDNEKIIANINDAHLKGNSVHLTPELRLLAEKGFYYVKLVAVLKGKKDNLLYTVEIEFKNKEICDEFSYIVKHINEPKFDEETEKLSSYKTSRAPTPLEQIHFIDRLEKSAKRTLEELKSSLSQESNQD